MIRKCFFTSTYFSPFNLKSLLDQKLPSWKAKFCFSDWQINFQFFQMLLAYNFRRTGRNAREVWFGDEINLLLEQKWEENISKFYFCIRVPTFLTHMPYLFIIKICFTNKVNEFCRGGQLLDSGSQGPRIPSPTVPGPGSQCLGSQVPGSQVLILDYTHIFGFSGKGNMVFPDNIRKTIFRCNFLETLSFQNICRKFKISIYFFGKDDLSFSV